MDISRDQSFEVRCSRSQYAMGCVMAVCGLLLAIGFALHLTDRADRWAQLTAALGLVEATRRIRDLTRPHARIDDGAISYADEWMTRRVTFADVMSWAHTSEGAAVVLTTSDGLMWPINLGSVAASDRDRVLARLTARLPPASLLPRSKFPHRAFYQHALRDVALAALLIVAAMLVIDTARASHAGATPVSSIVGTCVAIGGYEAPRSPLQGG